MSDAWPKRSERWREHLQTVVSVQERDGALLSQELAQPKGVQAGLQTDREEWLKERRKRSGQYNSRLEAAVCRQERKQQIEILSFELIVDNVYSA